MFKGFVIGKAENIAFEVLVVIMFFKKYRRWYCFWEVFMFSRMNDG